jgi:hypothetical protein
LADKNSDSKTDDAGLPEKHPHAGHDEAGYQSASG